MTTLAIWSVLLNTAERMLQTLWARFRWSSVISAVNFGATKSGTYRLQSHRWCQLFGLLDNQNSAASLPSVWSYIAECLFYWPLHTDWDSRKSPWPTLCLTLKHSDSCGPRMVVEVKFRRPHHMEMVGSVPWAIPCSVAPLLLLYHRYRVLKVLQLRQGLFLPMPVYL